MYSNTNFNIPNKPIRYWDNIENKHQFLSEEFTKPEDWKRISTIKRFGGTPLSPLLAKYSLEKIIKIQFPNEKITFNRDKII